MSFYGRVIFPRLCDFLLGRPYVVRHRRDLLTQAAGEVLEIGFGTGLNLPHYPAGVRKITTVDPNAAMHRLAQKRIQQSGMEVEARTLRGEALPFDDGRFDCVVSTFTLCSIDGVKQALAEVYRVLRPGGRFLFLEHGLSPEPGVQRWQLRLNGLQQWLGDGCRLDRNIQDLVADQPFQSVDLAAFYVPEMPRTHGYLYRGSATKSPAASHGSMAS